jgi:hypothetical protein
MKFVAEDFHTEPYSEYDIYGETAAWCADKANAKLTPLLERLEHAEDALRVCSRSGSPTAMKYFTRYPEGFKQS